jgi:23S rRNA pseudouridine2605 synthase
MAAKEKSSGGRHAKKTPQKSSFKKMKTKNFRPNPQNVKTFKRKPNTTPKKENVEAGIRLNKYIANAGVCSRREADVYIAAGNATVNGKIITEMGYKVQVDDLVRFDGSLLSMEEKRYVLMNKPKNCISTMEDDRGRKTVMDIIQNATKERIYPVGRLDRNTTGLLLFTNDGEMAKKLTSPKHNVKKLYHASLDKKLSIKDMQTIANNFMLEGKMVFVDAISYVEGESKTEVGIEIHSGRNRIVRKIFEHFGYAVVKLDRVILGGLTKKNLPRGHYRPLTNQEVINLNMI